MKLMLTSTGITNPSLVRTLKLLVGKRKIKIAFIPTAANVDEGGKDWLIKNLNECNRLGLTDIVDISAMPKSLWLPRLKAANVIFVGGGTTPHIMGWMTKSGLEKELPRLLKNRVYVGISAGSILMAKRLSGSTDFLYGSRPNKAPLGLGYVKFNLRPHFNSSHFPKARDKYLKMASKRLKEDLYAIDDESAIVWVDGKVRVVSEGRWKKYTKTGVK